MTTDATTLPAAPTVGARDVLPKTLIHQALAVREKISSGQTIANGDFDA